MISQRSHVDQMGFVVNTTLNPSRIVSLVPSQTELLHYLELTDNVVGITKFCTYPAHWKKEKTIIGGTKNFHFDKIDALQPDLIIGNKEENYPIGITRLKEKYPVWMSDVNSLQAAFQMIHGIGEITGKTTAASQLIQTIQKGFNALEKSAPQKSVLYFIWKEPWMVAGANTFIDDILNQIGVRNAAANLERYPILSNEAMRSLSPELVFLSSEPYPFTTRHIKELEALFPSARVVVVNGEYFSWYGSRLQQSPEYFKHLIEQLSS